MQHFKETIDFIKNDTSCSFTESGEKLEQKTRNRYKTLLTAALLADIQEALPDYYVGRIEKGVGISVENEKGTIPILIDASLKGLQFDVKAANDAYTQKQENKAIQKAEKLKEKQIKMEQDAIKREEKRLKREQLEAEKQARLEKELQDVESKN